MTFGLAWLSSTLFTPLPTPRFYIFLFVWLRSLRFQFFSLISNFSLPHYLTPGAKTCGKSPLTLYKVPYQLLYFLWIIKKIAQSVLARCFLCTLSLSLTYCLSACHVFIVSLQLFSLSRIVTFTTFIAHRSLRADSRLVSVLRAFLPHLT